MASLVAQAMLQGLACSKLTSHPLCVEARIFKTPACVRIGQPGHAVLSAEGPATPPTSPRNRPQRWPSARGKWEAFPLTLG